MLRVRHDQGNEVPRFRRERHPRRRDIDVDEHGASQPHRTQDIGQDIAAHLVSLKTDE